jgi:hypothetical protein
VFQRVRTKFFQLHVWKRGKDTFKRFGVFKGRLYPERSDITPNGRHFLYFAMAGSAWAVPGTGGTWTALAEVGSMSAQSLWGIGDTWGGGGAFLSNKEYWLQESHVNELRKLKDSAPLKRVLASKRPTPAHMSNEFALDKGWTLVKARKGYRVESETEPALAFPDWEWAGWDRNRLVWTQHGKLFGAPLERSGLGSAKLIYDFNEDE